MPEITDDEYEAAQYYGQMADNLSPNMRHKLLQRWKKEMGEVTEARFGYEGVVNQPTLFLAGEAGSEHVKISPTKRNKPSAKNILDWRNFI